MDRKIEKPRWLRHGRRLVMGVACVALLSLLATLYYNKTERTLRLSAAGITISTVEQGVYHDFLPIRGQVVPRETVFLDALEGGRVEKVLVEAGDSVVANQPLVKLSNTELELEVLDREGRLIESITQLQAYQTQLEQNRLANDKALEDLDYNIVRLRRALQRRRSLVQTGLIPQEQYDALQDELDSATRLRPIQEHSNAQQDKLRTEQLPQVQAEIARLRDDVKITRAKLENLTVRSPVAGRMTAIDLKVGENRNRGDRLGQITVDNGYKVSAQVDEFYLGQVHSGQTATVRISDHVFGLRVERVYPEVKSSTFGVDLAFVGANPPEVLPGQAVQGRLALGVDARGLVLANGAFLERTGGAWVFVLDESGKSATRRPIKIGRRNAEQVEIVSGLRPHDRVIISDYSSFEHIDRIILQE